jgi:hypothetical protein
MPSHSICNGKKRIFFKAQKDIFIITADKSYVGHPEGRKRKIAPVHDVASGAATGFWHSPKKRRTSASDGIIMNPI